jgi:hypothetical protein
MVPIYIIHVECIDIVVNRKSFAIRCWMWFHLCEDWIFSHMIIIYLWLQIDIFFLVSIITKNLNFTFFGFLVQ